MIESRLMECETRIAYQEDTLRVLNEVVTRQQMQIDQLIMTCRQLAERIARNGPLALHATKQMVRTASTDLERAKVLAAEWQPKVFGSEDAKEGATAFIEKRDPTWQDR